MDLLTPRVRKMIDDARSPDAFWSDAAAERSMVQDMGQNLGLVAAYL